MKKLFSKNKIIVFIILILITLTISFFIYKSNLPKTPKQRKIVAIPETKVNTIKEWDDYIKHRTQIPPNIKMVEKEWIFYGLNGLGYYVKQKAINDAKIAKMKQERDEEKIILLNDHKHKVELEQIGVETYGKDFYQQIDDKYITNHKTEADIQKLKGIKSIQERLQTQKEPKDLLMGEMDDVFLDTPFSEWKGYFGRSGFYPADGSLLMADYPEMDRACALEIEHPEDPNIVKISYKGPKYLLDLDKDYFIGETILHTNQFYYDRGVKMPVSKKYHLHFNPVRNIISVFTEKFNTGRTDL
ncbi:hypothetical protein J8J04_00260 ['Fragaria x ananassa' phyllody phytoplasma]|uniref:Uncharacterized protein n=1 Tax='Fragaria x ananassa' phyllody phytoplasma TaxID=2358428 RepID=A0ABS5K2Q2_9MOLU|nr:hypothetical protein ['Fragaria x ananassa' phyllody phytoplasma]MBS2126157.1 hypothetical protein ['Fragaria x ananassa' phyllody phytoplasma]